MPCCCTLNNCPFACTSAPAQFRPLFSCRLRIMLSIKSPAAQAQWVSTPEFRPGGNTPNECVEVAGDDLLSNSGEVKYDTSA